MSRSVSLHHGAKRRFLVSSVPFRKYARPFIVPERFFCPCRLIYSERHHNNQLTDHGYWLLAIKYYYWLHPLLTFILYKRLYTADFRPSEPLVNCREPFSKKPTKPSNSLTHPTGIIIRNRPLPGSWHSGLVHRSSLRLSFIYSISFCRGISGPTIFLGIRDPGIFKPHIFPCIRISQISASHLFPASRILDLASYLFPHQDPRIPPSFMSGRKNRLPGKSFYHP